MHTEIQSARSAAGALWSGRGANLCSQEIDDSFKRIEAEGLPYRRPKILVCIDVVENEAAVRSLQILDTTDVKVAGSHQFLAIIYG